ncbi:MAG TPA: NAD(P)-dependent oxidoreductase [Candidatus Limnocylindrales bacterium]|nr:NAD(P)-dependent oxidoreductase [Candidatus Limnocylindrales bacterium]
MRVLVTGAAGTLGRALIPRLIEAGHEPVALDLVPSSDVAEGVVGDVRDGKFVSSATRGVNMVVHAAALHGIHLRDHSLREFYDLNVTGTFNVWQAAVEHGVGGVVFSSTMGVYGESRTPSANDAVAFVEEGVPLRPSDIYGWSKVVGEELCAYHWRDHGIPSIALRFGMFVPESFFRYGIRLLYGGVDEVDAADAVLAALAALGRGEVAYGAYNVEAPVPFTVEDAPDLRRDPLAALERHLPGSSELLRARGVRSLKPITEVFPVSRLAKELGFHPRYDFAAWLEQLSARPGARAVADPPWP